MAAKSGTHVIIVGGGLAGLSAAQKVCEAGGTVSLFSIVPVKRSHSVCAQGGINGAVNTKGQGDSPELHFKDTIKGGDFLANQKLPKLMCDAAPKIIYLFDRMGVTFNRTTEGLLDFRRFGGTLHHRTAFAGASTGQQLLYALDEQVRRYEAEGKVEKFEGWEYLRQILDEDGVCRGIVATYMPTMELRAFKADAVCIATGGPGLLFGKSTNSSINTGGAAAATYAFGACYANGEFIQIHPTAIPGSDKLRLISESVRGEGGRVWVYKDGKPWYFLEEKYPRYGNLVPRDVASREIHDVVYNKGLGIDGKPQVYLDVTHLPKDYLDTKLKAVLEIYEKFAGFDPRKVPMKVFPGVHYSMGGLWIDDNHMTNTPGLFAAGEVDYHYHGANRLGANSLVSCIFGGYYAAERMMEFLANQKKSGDKVAETVFTGAVKSEHDEFERIKGMGGKENCFRMLDELGDLMTENVTIVRYNNKLKETDVKLQELSDRWKNVGISDKSANMNREILFTRQFKYMLSLARVIALGALKRDESRGSHYKPEFPDRNDDKFLKTTKAKFTGLTEVPEITYEDVDTSLMKPVARKYD